MRYVNTIEDIDEIPIILLNCVRTAVNDDLSTVDNYCRNSFKHYMFPISREVDIPQIKFITLKDQWENDTAVLSSISDIVLHPAYQQIIGMGKVAIPLILNEIKVNPGHWFWALTSITGENPIQQKNQGKIKEMTKDWLKWGKEQGYI